MMGNFLIFNPGDILKVQYPAFPHYGIYIGEGKVIHASKEHSCVKKSTLKEFSDNRQIRHPTKNNLSTLLALLPSFCVAMMVT